MTNPKQSVPLSVPVAAASLASPTPVTGVNDVTIAPVANGTSALDTKPDARTTLPANATPADGAPKTDVAKPEPAKPEEVTAAAAGANKPASPADKKKKKKKTTTTTTTKTSQE